LELTSAQQKKIRGQAQKVKATFQVGKNNITDALVDAIGKALAVQELLKVHVLNNAGIDKKEALTILGEQLNPDYSYTIGNHVVLFKQAVDKDKRKISDKL